jgi:hypothetical protein
VVGYDGAGQGEGGGQKGRSGGRNAGAGDISIAGNGQYADWGEDEGGGEMSAMHTLYNGHRRERSILGWLFAGASSGEQVHPFMAHAFMAYAFMACTFTAYAILAYALMAYEFMSSIYAL